MQLTVPSQSHVLCPVWGPQAKMTNLSISMSTTWQHRKHFWNTGWDYDDRIALTSPHHSIFPDGKKRISVLCQQHSDISSAICEQCGGSFPHMLLRAKTRADIRPPHRTSTLKRIRHAQLLSYSWKISKFVWRYSRWFNYCWSCSEFRCGEVIEMHVLWHLYLSNWWDPDLVRLHSFNFWTPDSWINSLSSVDKKMIQTYNSKLHWVRGCCVGIQPQRLPVPSSVKDTHCWILSVLTRLFFDEFQMARKTAFFWHEVWWSRGFPCFARFLAGFHFVISKKTTSCQHHQTARKKITKVWTSSLGMPFPPTRANLRRQARVTLRRSTNRDARNICWGDCEGWSGTGLQLSGYYIVYVGPADVHQTFCTASIDCDTRSLQISQYPEWCSSTYKGNESLRSKCDDLLH